MAEVDSQSSVAQSDEVILRSTAILSMPFAGDVSGTPCCPPGQLPSVKELSRLVELVKEVVFPGFFDKRQVTEAMRTYAIGVNMELLYSILRDQIRRGLLFGEVSSDCIDPVAEANEKALRFIAELPELRRVLYTDVEAMFRSDPAVSAKGEIIFCYPVVQAMVHHRVAHYLLKMGIPVIPRIISELAHSATGIDIHPGATIGEYFAIDHGTGVVIGETCIIGNHVTIYQGVTLGAKNFTLDESGRPQNLPRHPIIEDNVTIYSNASVLGRITVGRDAVIGGNVWVTESVPPGARILQRRAVDTRFTDGLGI